MSQTILAKKGKLTKRFPIEGWNLLKNKNGWEKVDEVSQPVVSTVKVAPDSGESKSTSSKKQIVENVVKTEKEIVAPEFVKNNISNDTESEDNSEDKTLEFIEFVKNNISKTQLKDYFDKNEIEYKNNLTLPALAEILAGYLKNNIDELKTAFGLNVANSGGL